MSFEIQAQYLQGVGAAVAAVRLFAVRLGARQPGLLAFLVYVAVNSVLLSLFPPDSIEYFWVYVVSAPVGWVVSIWAVREIISLAMAAYPGIRTACRWTMYAAVAVSSFVSLLITAAFWRGSGSAQRGLYYLLITERSVLFSLAVVIVSLLLFLSYYPIRLHHNQYVSCGFFSAIFLSQAVQQLFDSLAPNFYSRISDVAQLGVETLCLCGWALLLRREETVAEPPVEKLSVSRPEAAHLLEQLQTMDKFLSRAGRR